MDCQEPRLQSSDHWGATVAVTLGMDLSLFIHRHQMVAEQMVFKQQGPHLCFQSNTIIY